MKVSLIIPPSPFLGDQKRNTPLGILYIASWLEMHGHSVKVSDLRGVKEELWFHTIECGDLFGITSTTPEYPYAIKIAQVIRQYWKNPVIMIGGVHPTSEPESIDPALFDKVIIGEGEQSVLQVIKDIEQKVERRYYTCDKVIYNIDIIPFPARHLVPKESIISYTSTVAGQAATTIIGSRGCPYNCAFCASKSMWDRKVRFRDPYDVVREIRHLIDTYGVRHFRFQDDTITIKPQWIYDLCELLEPLNVTWRCTTRVDRVTYGILYQMKKAGCYEVAFGIETLEDSVLEMNNKQITNELIKFAITLAHAVDLKTRLFFMIGLPGQELDIADKIIAFIEDVKPTAVNLSTFVPLPGSDIYNKPEKYGIEFIKGDWGKYLMSKGLYGNEMDDPFIFKHNKLTDEQLRALRKKLLVYFEQHNLVYNK